MKVVHIITRLVVGGAQENTLASMAGLRAKPGLELSLITGPAIGPEGSLEERARAVLGGFTLVPELVRPVHPWKDARAYAKLVRLLRAQAPQLVHTHSGKAGFLGRLAARRAGVPIIVHHIHGPSFGPWQGAAANALFTAAERIAGRVTDHFLCSADAMRKRYLAAGIGRPDQYTRVFSGFDLAPFEQAQPSPELRAQLGLAAGDFVVGKVGRLFHLKGHADLIAAAPAILRACPRAKFLLVGDGLLRAELEEQARAAGVAAAFRFTGLVPPAEVPRYVALMDCLVHLSYREALSRALPQALAAGRPVVAYDFDGADEVCLENETGFLVRTGDVTAVADRVIRLADDAALRDRLGRRGRELVHDWFSIERMVETQYAVYRQLAAARGLAC
jgi:glycosyltransferase involved in cell wall biosynthesis